MSELKKLNKSPLDNSKFNLYSKTQNCKCKHMRRNRVSNLENAVLRKPFSNSKHNFAIFVLNDPFKILPCS